MKTCRDRMHQHLYNVRLLPRPTWALDTSPILAPRPERQYGTCWKISCSSAADTAYPTILHALSLVKSNVTARSFSPSLADPRKCPAPRPEDRGTRGQSPGSPLIRRLSPHPTSELICLSVQLLVPSFLFTLYIELRNWFVAIRVPDCGWPASRF